ncbi:MAG: EamA family transporter, partial [Candidatus Babeliales bacterium]
IIERNNSRCSMIDITFGIGLIGSLILALITYISGSLTLHAFSAITTYEWIAIMCIGAFGTSLSFFFYNTIIQTLSPNKANLLVFTLSPVVVALYAVVVEKQTLNSWQLLGIICILASIVPPFISKGKKL